MRENYLRWFWQHIGDKTGSNTEKCWCPTTTKEKEEDQRKVG